jgi:hypothetical protein
MRSSLCWDVTQRTLVVSYHCSEKPTDNIKGQAVQEDP